LGRFPSQAIRVHFPWSKHLQRDIQAHKRVNDILLGPLERPALAWLASHTPAWMTPDVMTAIGVLGSVVIFAGYGLSHVDPAFLWLASLGFVINWYGDSMDGTLARHRHIERPVYGFFVDHTIDGLSQTLIFIGLGLSPYVRIEYAFLALTGYLLMSILAYVSAVATGIFRLSYGRLGPTEVRMIAILSNSLVFSVGNPALNMMSIRLTVYDLIVLCVAGLLFGIFISSTLRQARALREAEGRGG
jgi:archaetidylinositol phosphate synthase